MTIVCTRMVSGGKVSPARNMFGFGKAAIVKIDFQNADTRMGEHKTACETDPDTIKHAEQLSERPWLAWPEGRTAAAPIVVSLDRCAITPADKPFHAPAHMQIACLIASTPSSAWPAGRPSVWRATAGEIVAASGVLDPAQN